MKFRHILPAAAICLGTAIALPATAQAGCNYNGITYSAGAKLCFGGWLQECTVANYWKAIGQCKLNQDTKRGVDQAPATSKVPLEKKKSD